MTSTVLDSAGGSVKQAFFHGTKGRQDRQQALCEPPNPWRQTHIYILQLHLLRCNAAAKRQIQGKKYNQSACFLTSTYGHSWAVDGVNVDVVWG